jgi:hypothetical protein
VEQADFAKYIPILQEKPFIIYPTPQGPGNSVVWHAKKLIYRDDTSTHVIVEDVATQKVYQLPLALVEFANTGILRLTRVVGPSNGSFI